MKLQIQTAVKITPQTDKGKGKPRMKTLTKEEMRRHIQHMINKHGLVTSQCDRPSQAWASRELEEICIPPINISRQSLTLRRCMKLATYRAAIRPAGTP